VSWHMFFHLRQPGKHLPCHPSPSSPAPAQVEEVLSGQHSQGVAHLAGVLAPDSVRSNYQRLTGAGRADMLQAAASCGSTAWCAPWSRRAVMSSCTCCV
jgi:hypothetical protein